MIVKTLTNYNKFAWLGISGITAVWYCHHCHASIFNVARGNFTTAYSHQHSNECTLYNFTYFRYLINGNERNEIK